jgi:ABC-type transport system substrate-binding protein
MQRGKTHPVVVFMLVTLLALVLTACGGQPEVIEIVVTATPTDETASDMTEPQAGSLKTPHPILSDVRVRQAIAYCTDRQELIEAIYPFLGEEQRQGMMMHTFIPRGHWAYTDEGITTYPFDPEQGIQLLEEAGWMENEFEDEPRINENGDVLALKFTTTDAQFRVTYATVLQQQLMENCGIQLIRTHAPASWWFGDKTGSTVRDFELGAYAWIGQADPGGMTMYACNQIPLPENGWNGQNYMGWCNETASKAIIAANTTLEREQRKEHYAVVQQEFTRDMVSLPLFNRFEAAAASNNVLNFKPDASESSYVTNIHEWELQDGGDTVIIGMSQEPSTFFALVDDLGVTQMVYDLVSTRAATAMGYDYQPVALTELPTIESGGAVLEQVDVTEGDMVYNTDGEAVELAPGMEVINAEGDLVTYEGDTISMNQITVNFDLIEGLTWEDGEPVKAADIELARKINCDPESGAVSLYVCEATQDFEVTSDTTFTTTYLPGALLPEYMVYTPGTFAGTAFTVGAYPSHRTLSDGRTLAEVPASEWSELPEVAQQPLSYGPYRLVEWEKGQRMIFEANPHYVLGEPKIKNLIIQFFSDTNTAVAQLLTGDVDVVGTETLGAGAELEAVINAGNEGDIQTFPIASATWEVMDMNLFVK